MSCTTGDTAICRAREGTWDRECWRVAMLAGELNIALDAETLLLYDVRELMALRLRLQGQLTGPARRHLLPRQRSHGML